MIATIRLFTIAMVLFGIASCGEPEVSTLSVIIENKSRSGETVVAMRFPNSPEMFEGWVAPARGVAANENINIRPPHDEVLIRLQSDAGARREFTLDLKGMGRVNDIGRIEYRLEITDQGMRAVPPAEWPKPGHGPAKPPPTDLGPLPPGLIPGNEPPSEPAPAK